MQGKTATKSTTGSEFTLDGMKIVRDYQPQIFTEVTMVLKNVVQAEENSPRDRGGWIGIQKQQLFQNLVKYVHKFNLLDSFLKQCIFHITRDNSSNTKKHIEE